MTSEEKALRLDIATKLLAGILANPSSGKSRADMECDVTESLRLADMLVLQNGKYDRFVLQLSPTTS